MRGTARTPRQAGRPHLLAPRDSVLATAITAAFALLLATAVLTARVPPPAPAPSHAENPARLSGSVAPSAPAAPVSRIIYVTLAGNDASTGSRSAPLRTISRAARVAVAGDTVLVAPGTFDERVEVTATASARRPIRFRAQTPGGTRVTEGFYVHGNGAVLDGFEVSGSHALGDGRRNSDGSFADGAVQVIGNDNVIRRMRIHDTRSGPWAILAAGRRNVVEYNLTRDVQRGHLGVSGTGVVVRRNRCTITPSFFADKPANHKSVLLQVGETDRMLIEHNYFRGPCDGNMVHVPVSVNRVTFRGNAFVLPGRRITSTTHTQTFGFYAPASDIVFDRNIIGSAEPYPAGFVAGFTHFFFGTAGGGGTFRDLTFTNNVFLGANDGDYYLQFKARDRVRGLRFDNNVIAIDSGWRLPTDTTGAVARRNVVVRGSVGGAADYNLYAGRVSAGEGAHSRSGPVKFAAPDTSAKSGYGVYADWTLRAAAPAGTGILLRHR